MLVMEETYLTPEEVAQKLRLSTATILRFLRHKQLPGIKVGGTWRVMQSDLEAFIHSLKEKSEK